MSQRDLTPDSSPLPSRWQGVVFGCKAKVLQARRALFEFGRHPPKHRKRHSLARKTVIGETCAKLWSQTSAAEFPLTAGKVENLRAAARALHGLEIPAGEVFSFWRQLGRTTGRRGFTTGRELREGCLIPNIGGGLCQITGLLYQAALEAGLTIVERHAHSRLIPGSMAEADLDATVFWNYVDLRFKADFPWRLEVLLDATDLKIILRAERRTAVLPNPEPPSAAKKPTREAATGDCLTCDQTACFRHPVATHRHAPAQGHSAFLLDARWPEFDRWCAGHSREGDRWLLPLDGRRWRKPNYAWQPPSDAIPSYATAKILLRTLRHRRLPAQGAVRQAALLKGDAALAKTYAARLSPECRHLVISQNLLPHLWKLGVLGGRTFDVLMQRWPLAVLMKRLDQAAARHPVSPTLGDFRPDTVLMQAEEEALAQAGKLVTPHRAIAAHFGSRAWLLDWDMSEVPARTSAPIPGKYFLPCSPLGRKGIYELQFAHQRNAFNLSVLGTAREGSLPDFFQQGTLFDLENSELLILPAWVEHQPRLALRALASGIPVIASKAVGLPPHPLLTEIDDPAELDEVLRIRDPEATPTLMSDQSDKEITLEAGTHWMCTCGKSANYPLCDGSHKGSGAAPKKLVLEETTTLPVSRPLPEN